MSLGKKQHYRFDYIWHQLAAGPVFHVYALIEEINDSNINIQIDPNYSHTHVRSL